MCGIFGALIVKSQDENSETIESIKNELDSNSELIRHRGPDSTDSVCIDNDKYLMYLKFHRLAIHDLSMNGMQPFVYKCDNRTVYLMCNGEIYNSKKLRRNFPSETFKSDSDCEVILYLYLKYGLSITLKNLIGEFSFCIVDIIDTQVQLYLARDPFGVRPLFYSSNDEYTQSNNTNCDMFSNDVCGSKFFFSSEMKGLIGLNNGPVQPFPPGSYGILKYGHFKNFYDFELDRYYNLKTRLNLHISKDEALKSIETIFTQCVIDRLDSDRPLGALLSGGLDSSTVCAIAARELAKSGKQLHTFTIGFEGAPDIKYARIVSKYINNVHTEFIVSPEEALSELENTIKCIESYDITTVRASNFQNMIAKRIRDNTDFKVIFSSELSDEMNMGYLYFRNTPTPEAGRASSKRLLNDVYAFDGLRADRCMSGAGLEIRVPFSDRRIVDFIYSLPDEWIVPTDCEYGTKMEKYFFRKAFESSKLLPNEVLYRMKSGMSDSTSDEGNSWYQIIQNHIETLISDHEFNSEKYKYIHNTPKTKESYYYRKIFEKYYPNQSHVIPYFWMPEWSNSTDPSARTLNVYKKETI
jgi:asparagine synthase (glutamine-hydrolysing)